MMVCPKTFVIFALVVAVAIAFDDTDDEMDRKDGRHGHHGRGGHGHHGRGGHHHHCHHHHHHHHGLTFFKELNETVQQQFIEIWRDDELTRDEKKAQINELAESVLTADQLTEFHKNQAEREQRRKQWREEMDKKITELSPNVRAAAEQIRAIWRDETISGPDSWKTKKEKAEKIKTRLSDAEKAELESVWGHRWGRRCGGFLSRLSFYEDLDQSIKDKFTAIFRNDDLNWGEKKAEVDRLAQTLFTPEQLSEFEKMKAEYQQRKKQRQAEMDAKIATFSPNARVAAGKLRAIFENDSLDWGEKREQMRAIKKELTESEQAELESLRPRGFHWRRADRFQSNESEEKKEGEQTERDVIAAVNI